MQPCHNCGELVDADKKICPNCGRDLTLSPPVAPPAVWPPPPEGFVAPSVPPPILAKLITGKPTGDYVLGLFAGLGLTALIALYGLGLLLLPLVYFTQRQKYPYFARGVGHVGLFFVVLLLGAVGYCMYALTYHAP